MNTVVRIIFLVLSMAVLVGCTILDGQDPDGKDPDLEQPGGEGPLSGITGTARFYPWDTHDLYSTANLSGYVDLLVGTQELSIPASSFSFFNYYYLEAPFEVAVQADGPVPIFLFSNLEYSDPPIFEGPVAYAGVALVDAVPGQMTDMYEGIPALAPSEYQDFYVPLHVDAGYTPTGIPEITDFRVDTTDSSVPFVSVSGSLANTDLAVAALKINNRYLLVDLETTGGGMGSFTQTIDLQPGTNTVELLGVSTQGHTVSEPKTVTFSPQGSPGSGLDIYATLTWDWPSSNMDIFVWYFDETFPDGSSTARWLLEANNPDVPPAPNGLASSGFFGGGTIGHAQGSEITFIYEETPAYLTLSVDDQAGSYSLSMGNGGDVVFDLTGSLGGQGGFWDGTGTGTFDLGIPETAAGFFATGGFGLATMTGVTGVLTITHNETGLATGSITLTGPQQASIPTTDFTLSFSDARYEQTEQGTLSSSNPYMNLDLKESQGYGPEHLTLYDAPDGYYVFAVASISMTEPEHSPNSFLHSRVFLGAQIGGKEYRFSPHWFEHHHGDPITQQNAPEAYWFRAFDVRINQGKETVISPNTTLELPGYPSLRGLR